ncbi:MAG TPA: hypothetical protein VGJ26_18730 [Pirellulales bacterium]
MLNLFVRRCRVGLVRAVHSGDDQTLRGGSIATTGSKLRLTRSAVHRKRATIEAALRDRISAIERRAD